MSQMGNAQMQRAGAVTDEYFILISNIPFRSRWQDLKDLVRTVTPHVEHAEIYLMNNGRSRGHGYVKIKGREEAEKVYEFLSHYVWDGRALVVALGNANASVPVAIPEGLSGPQPPETSVVPMRRPDPLFSHHPVPPSVAALGSFAYVVPLQPEYLDDRLLVSSMPGASPAELGRARYEVCLQAYTHYMAEAHNVGMRMRIQAATVEQDRQNGNLRQATEGARRVELLVESQKNLEAQAVTARAQMLHAYQACNEVVRDGPVPTPYMTSPLTPYTIPPAMGPALMSIPVATTSSLAELPMIMPQPQPFAHVTYTQSGPLYVSAPNGTPINLTHGAVQTEARGIFIGGLPYEAEWQELKDRLKAAGNVIRCEVPKRSNDGRGKGYATALFSTHEEAKAAVEMFHDTEFKGRTIRVKLDAQRTTMRPPTAGSASSEEVKTEETPRQPIIVDGSSSSRTISANHSPKMVGTSCW